MSSKPFLIKVIGAFDVIDRHRASLRPSGRKECALLALLALTRNHRQTRTWLQEKLWGDRGPAQAAASLRQSLTTLRNQFKDHGDVIRADRTWVWLDNDLVEFDHAWPGANGEILRGFDLREEGFNDWLRSVRAEFAARTPKAGPDDPASAIDRLWHVEAPVCTGEHSRVAGICEFVREGLVEALSVIGANAALGCETRAPSPKATDMIVRLRGYRFGTSCVLSLSVTDGFGALKWQVRREAEQSRPSEIRAIQIELSEVFQDFVLRTEARALRGGRWSAHANGCHALMGVLVPGSVPLREIARCSEAAIATDEKGVYHALLGASRLLMFGEREIRTFADADEVFQSFRTALRLSPDNGLVQALVGHSYGFLLRDLDRNDAMTAEAVRLLPGSGPCWLFRAISLAYCGRPVMAVDAATRAVALCRGTQVQPMALSTLLFAQLLAGDTAGAIRAGEMSLETMEFRPTIMDLMAAYAMEGRVHEGRAKLDRLIVREPDLSVDMLRSAAYPIVNVTHRALIAEAAGRLGLR
jgi:hypothetical protein